MSKFYTFSQNNSGGHFAVDEKSGIAEYVIIEASDAKDANKRAKAAGIYFNGCDTGEDCSCCGDRWYSQYDDADAADTPEVYGQPASTYKSEWGTMRGHIAVHYIDGHKDWFTIEKLNKEGK